ncbi:MAG: O-antigen ligase family protein [Bacteroidota bacterium]|nr:O-antigen ligase family protein [Bacteroidota bacterium]
MDDVFRNTGAEKIKHPIVFIILLILSLGFGWVIGTKGIVIGILLFLIPFFVFYLVVLLQKPKLGFATYLVLSFTAIGIMRYIPGNIPFGLSVDFVLILTFFSLIFKQWRELDWSPVRNFLSVIAIIWFLYTALEIVNPQKVSPTIAWVYAIRGVSLYMLLTVVIGLLLVNKISDFYTFLKLWMFFSLIATLKGLQQDILGPDPWEQAALDAGMDVTHIIWGELRVFSFLSDAGQFGASQAHTAVVAGIIAIGPGKKKTKIIFGLVSLMGVIGMAISGTRGAIAIPGVGGLVYFALSRNMKVFVLGVLFAAGTFVFLKYTTIAQGNYTVNRMRSSLNPEDPSLQIRLKHQRWIKEYIKSRPFGVGIGSAGSWGLRFSPNQYISQIATDSWYVKVYIETGLIGLLLHIGYLLFIFFKGVQIAWYKVKDPQIRQILLGLLSGYFGLLVASYGNGILGQLPTGTLVYLSWVFIVKAPELEKQKINKPEFEDIFK